MPILNITKGPISKNEKKTVGFENVRKRTKDVRGLKMTKGRFLNGNKIAAFELYQNGGQFRKHILSRWLSQLLFLRMAVCPGRYVSFREGDFRHCRSAFVRTSH